jgi:hypothetical protein
MAVFSTHMQLHTYICFSDMVVGGYTDQTVVVLR